MIMPSCLHKEGERGKHDTELEVGDPGTKEAKGNSGDPKGVLMTHTYDSVIQGSSGHKSV